MFGLLDIKTCSLKKETKRFYACNVCNALSSQYGRTSRVLLTNDSVYLSLLIDAQRHKSEFSQQNITCKTWSKKSLSYPEFEYPAAVSLLQSGVNLYDDIEDEKSAQAKILYFFYKNRLLQAERNLKNFGISIPSIKDISENQQQRELKPGFNLDYYSYLTEQMYSKIFAQSAILANAYHNYQYLANVGKDIGRIAYFLDGYVDFEQDQKNGKFNVFSKIKNSSNLNIKENRELLNKIINEALYRIKDNISKVELYRHADKIRYIVTDGLKVRIQNILNGNGIWLTKPQIILGLVPFAFILMQMDGGECCPCGECEPGVGYPCSLGEASGSAPFGDRIGSAAAEGIVGAAVGVGGAAIISGSTSSSGESVSTKSEDTSVPDINAESLPESNPEKPPLSIENWSNEDKRKRIESRIPPDTPQNFPLLDAEEMAFNIDFNQPVFNENKKVFEELIKINQEKIKYDIKAENERKKRGISLDEEFKEIWNSRPKAVDEWYKSIDERMAINFIKNINDHLDDGIADISLSFLEQKLLKSSKPEEREWIKKFQSNSRRKRRFFNLTKTGRRLKATAKTYYLGPNDAKIYVMGGGSRA